MKYKSLLICALALASFATAARADEVTFTGSTSGSFNHPNADLTFAPSAFSETTFSGNAALPVGSFSTHGLGYTPGATDTFTLTITFTAPLGISGGQGPTFTATITGAVSTTNGQLTIDFGSTPTHFTFNDAGHLGSFDLLVDKTVIKANQTIAFNAAITNATVPDGGSAVTLFGIALIGLGVLRRKLRLA
jgi:hypothetical protein